jgi:hypothetical protein
MLIIMTYSVPLCLMVVLGIVGGHLLFNAKDALLPARPPVKNVPGTPLDDSRVSTFDSSRGEPLHDGPQRGKESPGFVPEGATPCCQHDS